MQCDRDSSFRAGNDFGKLKNNDGNDVVVVVVPQKNCVFASGCGNESADWGQIWTVFVHELAVSGRGYE